MIAKDVFKDLEHLTAAQWAGMAASVLFFFGCAYTCMIRWSAVLVLRTTALTGDVGCVHHVLAPAFVAGFYKATASRMAKAYGLVVFIVVIGIVVAHMPYPWRQIVDLGVVINLIAGTLALLAFSGQTFLMGRPPKTWGQTDFKSGDAQFRASGSNVNGENGARTQALVAV